MKKLLTYFKSPSKTGDFQLLSVADEGHKGQLLVLAKEALSHYSDSISNTKKYL